MSDFAVCVKSSLDKIMNDLVTSLQATYPTLQGAELDDTAATAELFGSDAPGLLWQLLTVSPHPRDPLYEVQFIVGAKTIADAGNYKLADLAMHCKAPFEVDTRIAVGDYSGAVAVLGKGYFIVRQNQLAPQQFEEQAGIRFYTVTGIGARLL